MLAGYRTPASAMRMPVRSRGWQRFLSQQLPHDRIQVDSRAIHVRKVCVGFVEDQRQVRARENDGIQALPLDQLERKIPQSFVLFLRAPARVGHLEISFMNDVD